MAQVPPGTEHRNKTVIGVKNRFEACMSERETST